jgi:nucleoside-diphosphate-sugar epimerase
VSKVLLAQGLPHIVSVYQNATLNEKRGKGVSELETVLYYSNFRGFRSSAVDDPRMRKPDISKAKSLLHWEPKVSLRQGLPRMVSDFQKRILDEK